MKNLVQEKYNKMAEHATALSKKDFWILIKSGAMGGFASLIPNFLLMSMESANLRKLRRNFIIDNAAKYDCQHRTLAGGDIISTTYSCSNQTMQIQFSSAVYTYIDSVYVDSTNLYIPLLLIGIALGLIYGIFKVKRRHEDNWKIMELNQATAKISNLAKLEIDAKKILQDYQKFYSNIKNSSRRHPNFLCEPNSQELMDIPIVVGSDGYARGFKHFKKMIEEKCDSEITGKPLAAYGIIDRVLMGNLLAYLQQQDLPEINVLIYKKHSKFYQKIRVIFEFVRELLGGLKYFIKKTLRTNLFLFAFFSGLGYFFASNHPKVKTSEISQFEAYLEKAPLFMFISFFISVVDNAGHLVSTLSNWLDRKIQQADIKPETDDIYAPNVERKVSDRFVCPLTHQIIRDFVICEDGRTYEQEAIELALQNQPQKIKKSPVDHSTFKNQYPLIWVYTQRQEESRKSPEYTGSSHRHARYK
jgi:hypothetical protein